MAQKQYQDKHMIEQRNQEIKIKELEIENKKVQLEVDKFNQELQIGQKKLQIEEENNKQNYAIKQQELLLKSNEIASNSRLEMVKINLNNNENSDNVLMDNSIQKVQFTVNKFNDDLSGLTNTQFQQGLELTNIKENIQNMALDVGKLALALDNITKNLPQQIVQIITQVIQPLLQNKTQLPPQDPQVQQPENVNNNIKR